MPAILSILEVIMRRSVCFTSSPDVLSGNHVPAAWVRVGVVALGLLVLILAGCAGGKKEETQVSGKVEVNGAAADPGSRVTYIGEGGKQASSVTGEGGAYTIMVPPVGNVQIVVTGNAVPKVSAGGSPPPGMMSHPGAPIPPKYSRPNNGLTYTVTAGKQTHDINLIP